MTFIQTTTARRLPEQLLLQHLQSDSVSDWSSSKTRLVAFQVEGEADPSTCNTVKRKRLHQKPGVEGAGQELPLTGM